MRWLAITQIARRLALSLLVTPPLLWAADAPEVATRPHYAFATYLGTGFYTIDGQDTWVLRLPLGKHAPLPGRETLKARTGVDLGYVTSLGFTDYAPERTLKGELPKGVATLAFVPSLKYPLQVNEQWQLVPFGDLGLAVNNSDNSTVTIYSTGITSYYRFEAWSRRFTLANRLRYAGYDELGDGGISDDYVSVESVLDVRLPLGYKLDNHPAELSLYLMKVAYLNNLDFHTSYTDLASIDHQNEIGFTYGVEGGWQRWGMTLPRLGIGYREGHDFRAIRLIAEFPL